MNLPLVKEALVVEGIVLEGDGKNAEMPSGGVKTSSEMSGYSRQFKCFFAIIRFFAQALREEADDAVGHSVSFACNCVFFLRRKVCRKQFRFL